MRTNRGGLRLGFTILEIVIAVLLLTVAALGYAAVATGFSSVLLQNRARTRAGDSLIAGREMLLRDGCDRASSGDGYVNGIHLRWDVAAQSGGVRAAMFVAERAGPNGIRFDSLGMLIPCS